MNELPGMFSHPYHITWFSQTNLCFAMLQNKCLFAIQHLLIAINTITVFSLIKVWLNFKPLMILHDK